MIRRTVNLQQCFNPRYNTRSPEPDQPEFIYKVTKVTNSLEVHVGQILRPDRVDELIGSHWTVNITTET